MGVKQVVLQILYLLQGSCMWIVVCFFLMIIRDFLFGWLVWGFLWVFLGGGLSWVFVVALGLSRWGTEVAPGMWHLSSPVEGSNPPLLPLEGRLILNYWPTRSPRILS